MTTIDEILEQEEQLANAKRALDLGAIDRICADDRLLIACSGKLPAQECRDGWKGFFPSL